MDADTMPTRLTWNDIPDPNPVDLMAAGIPYNACRMCDLYGPVMRLIPNTNTPEYIPQIPVRRYPLHDTDDELTTWEDGQHSVQMLGISIFAALAIAVIVFVGTVLWLLT